MPSEIRVSISASDNENQARVPALSSSSSSSDSTEEDEIVIGETPLDPHSTTHCWSCFVPFRDGSDSYYTQHEHPTLGIVVCSVCCDGGESVERKILDSPPDNANNDASVESETYCSFCSLPSSSLNPPYPPLADERPNDLFLCDSCPRAFCQKCICITYGGSKDQLEHVRKCAVSDEEWNCALCRPTAFLGQMRLGYTTLLEDTDANNSISGNGNEAEEETLAKLIDELRGAESKYSQAQDHLEDDQISKKKKEIETELLSDSPTLSAEEMNSMVEEEIESYRELWIRNSERLQETIGKLLNELEDGGVNVADVYKFWEKEEEGEDVKEEGVVPGWKREADLALDARDIDEGFGKGEFRGATGYKANDTRIYKLEPEDLNQSSLKEIEDINTTHGAIIQMNRLKTHQEKSNQWGSKTGITDVDIEMFEKKCTKYEEFTLGDKIDLKALERNYTKDTDDAVRVKTEGHTMTVRRKNGNGPRVVKRTATVRSAKMQDDKESVTAQLSGYEREYKPSIPAVRRVSDGVAPKPKKRALLQSSSSFGAVTVKGMIGSDVPFVDSDIVLPTKHCAAKVTIFKDLASLLKEHQVEGVKFCWDQICQNLFEPSNEVFGAILAHSMGVGKSLQTVALLHTLLTHPALVRSSASMNGSISSRIVQRVLLVAPANWEAEFRKWVGANNLPFVRFLPWDGGLDLRQKAKLISEWCKTGGILCCSDRTFASTVKAAKDDTKDAKVSEQDRTTMYKGLVNPGPNMITLDEAHTMLKNNNTEIFKALDSIKTQLRLCLTGTPLQNNLMEYYRMSNWTRPGCLGTEAQFIKKYETPIMDGMAADCLPSQVELQEKLSSELHQLLSAFVHRCSKDVLKKVLPFMQEAVIHVRQSKSQTKLYREFNKYKRLNSVSFFKQYHALTPVSNHPACLPFFRLEVARSDSPAETDTEMDVKKVAAPNQHAWFCDKCKTAQFETFEEAEEHEATCTESPDDSFEDGESKEQWWKNFHDKVMRSGLNINALEHGGKVVMLLQILAHCDAIGDKVVVFSKCIRTLDFIEEILQSPTWHGFTPFLPNHQGTRLGGWAKNNEYSRIDGQVNAVTRGDLINSFNTVDHSKLFLVSIKAGGLGVNLVAANRVVLFDAHFNPAITDQAVHRCYRFGQTKPVFVYQLLAEGSMEEKIYSRSKNKTVLADLVIDEKNIERLYSRRELDLMQENDTWVSCEACEKWRMLPPDMPDDEVANLPDKWYCRDNIHDPDRSFCEAPTQNALWYAYHWENRMKESQGLAPYVAPTSDDHSFDKFAKRDEVLETLLERCERSSGDNSKTTINSWISKYFFSKETIKDAEVDEAKTSPTKKKHCASPMKSPRKSSPKKTTTPKEKVESIAGDRIPKKRLSSGGEQKENQPKRSPAVAGCAEKSNVKEEKGEAAGQKRKSPQQNTVRAKTCKPNTPIKTPSKDPEVIDLIDSDED